WLCVALSFGLAIVVFRRRRATRKTVLVHGGMLLAGIIAGVFACAVQVLPGLDMKRNIDRGNAAAPLSVWDLAGSRLHGSQPAVLPSDPLFAPDTSVSKQNTPGMLDNILCRRLDQPGHASSIYRFSLPPWRLSELIFPNVGGDWVSGRGRWFTMFPHDDQLWTASLYIGIIPFLLVVWAVLPVSSRAKRGLHPCRMRGYRSWAIWLAVLATLAAFGAFGPGWLIRVMSHGWDNDIHNGDPVGGLYWFMVVFLPQFATFRYPAKLTVLIVLALALLAGIGLDRLRSEQNRGRLAIFVFVPSGILCTVTALFGPVLLETFNGRTFAGSIPLDALAVSHSLAWTFGQTALVAFLFWLILTWAKTDTAIRKASLMIILVLTAFDLAWAHQLLIPSVPDEVYRSKSLVTQTIQEDHPGNSTDLQPVRVWRGIQWNPFLLTNQNDRLQQAFVLDRKTLAPKYSYVNRLGIANVHGTGIEHSYRLFLERIESMSQDESQRIPMLEMLARCNVQYLVMPWQDQQGKQVVLPRAKLLDALTPRQYSLLDQPEQAFEHLADPWPINTLVWRNDVPCNMLQIKATGVQEAGNTAKATLTSYTATRIEFDADCPSTCDIVVAEQYWNGWKTRAVSKENPEVVLTLATNRDSETGFLRQLSLPPGTWHVTMEYRPASVYWGIVVSFIAWLLLIAASQNAAITCNRLQCQPPER
ncbi:MAG: hypothetical protein Q4G59_04575, partial [Planctomycetia bacterium]|nr:hypothetical protein [Planctomycetia bacterium]